MEKVRKFTSAEVQKNVFHRSVCTTRKNGKTAPRMLAIVNDYAISKNGNYSTGLVKQFERDVKWIARLIDRAKTSEQMDQIREIMGKRLALKSTDLPSFDALSNAFPALIAVYEAKYYAIMEGQK